MGVLIWLLMVTMGGVTFAKPPHLFLVVADDLGSNDVGWVNNRTITPHLDRLVAGGLELTQFYVFKYCAPTRGALMTGRYPYHFGFYSNQDANDYGVPTNFTMLPATLAANGYKTHMIGKWHLGFREPHLTPTYRGFDTFLGYYHMEEDYYTHAFGAESCGAFLDFSNSSGTDIRPLRNWTHSAPAGGKASCDPGSIDKNQCRHGLQHQILNFSAPDAGACCARCATTTGCQSWTWFHPGALASSDGALGGTVAGSTCCLDSTANTVKPNSSQCDSGVATGGGQSEADYSAMVFTAEAQRIMVRHVTLDAGSPLFMYLPYQSVHGPDEAPARFLAMYDGIYTDPTRKLHQAMVTALDEGIGNLTATMKATGLYENAVMWFTSDNGGPLGAANNYPQRGGKFTNWEGGTMVRSFIHSPLLPESSKGGKHFGLAHAVDVYPTFLAWANLSLPGSTGPSPMDGVSQLGAILRGAPSPRTTIFYSPVVEPYNPVDCPVFGQSCGGGIRIGDFKLLVGYPGDSRRVVEPTAAGAVSAPSGLEGDGIAVGPLLDGCNETTGEKCPCHHLNGGPCLYNVVEDPDELTNLAAANPAKVAALLAEFQKMSATGLPPAGLTGPDLRADVALRCKFLNATAAFEPYGQPISWPHPLP